MVDLHNPLHSNNLKGFHIIVAKREALFENWKYVRDYLSRFTR